MSTKPGTLKSLWQASEELLKTLKNLSGNEAASGVRKALWDGLNNKLNQIRGLEQLPEIGTYCRYGYSYRKSEYAIMKLIGLIFITGECHAIFSVLYATDTSIHGEKMEDDVRIPVMNFVEDGTFNEEPDPVPEDLALHVDARFKGRLFENILKKGTCNVERTPENTDPNPQGTPENQ